jgi:flagellar protein FliO/FliZ
LDNATLAVPEVGLGLAAVKMAGAMLLLLALLLLGLALLKRYGLAAKLQGGGSGAALRIEERMMLGPRKQLVVVRFLNRRLLLGITDTGINLIAEDQADHAHKIDFQTTLEQADSEDSSM